MSDNTENRKAPAFPSLSWPSSLKCDTLAIKTSLVHDQLKVNWTIDEFGTIPNKEILELYDTTFLVGVKKDIPCQWKVGLTLSQVPTVLGNGNSDVEELEERLQLTYAIQSAPPNAFMVWYRLAAQVKNPFGGEPFSYDTPNLAAWNNLGDKVGIDLVPRPKLWPKYKPLKIDLDLTVVVKIVKTVRTPLGEGIQGQKDSDTENVSSTCVVVSPPVKNPLKRKEIK